MGFKTNDAYVKFANKMVGYGHRHLAQKPQDDVKDTNWRYSQMNWGMTPIFSL